MHFLQKQSDYFSNDPRISTSYMRLNKITACIHAYSLVHGNAFFPGRESKPGGRELRSVALPGRSKQARRCDPYPRAEWCQREPDPRRVRLVVNLHT